MPVWSTGPVDPVFADPRSRRVTAGMAFGLIGLWIALSAGSLSRALPRMVDPQLAPTSLDLDDVVRRFEEQVVWIAVGFMAIGGVLHFLPAQRLWWQTPGQPSALAMTRFWGGAQLLALACAGAASTVGLRMEPPPVPAVESGAWLHGLTMVLAGLEEEPLLAALPVILLVGRMPVLWIAVLAGVMRGLLHTYYGPAGFVWAFVWGGAAVLIYFVFRRLWLLIVLHGLSNAPGLALGHGDWWELGASLVKASFLVGLGVWCMIAVHRDHPHLRQAFHDRIWLALKWLWFRVHTRRLPD